MSCYKELKLTTKPFTGRTLRGLLILMQNIRLRSSGMRRKQNSKWHCSLLLLLLLSLLSSVFAFLASFFSLSGHLVGFILVGKIFRKAFRILVLDERKLWVRSETRFSWKFSGQCYMCVCLFFSAVLDWIVLILLWFERSLHSAQASGQSYPW